MLKKSFSRGSRQPTPRPSQEGKTGDNPPLAPPRRGRQETTHPSPLPGGEDRRNGNERGGRSKNCPMTFDLYISATFCRAECRI
ncbi:MAG: hypothetical protein F6K48_28270 [Okeania sp. SIO3H1]|nr:hypothetical protein [Okeania sp. SIO3H1]